MKALIAFFKNALFPKFCFACGRLGAYLCPRCQNNLSTIKQDVCPYCERASYFGLTHYGCRRCMGLDGLKAIFYYGDLTKKIIKNIKYQLVKEAIADFLQAIPRQKIEELFFYKQLAANFTFIPVPLHPKRERKRGFNQAEELAKFFSTALGFPIRKDLVIRTKDTKPQVEMKKPKERYKNILGAFSLEKSVATDQIEGKNFIIFDDVWTTGWTIKEISRILKKAGAAKVFALTVAR